MVIAKLEFEINNPEDRDAFFRASSADKIYHELWELKDYIESVLDDAGDYHSACQHVVADINQMTDYFQNYS